MVLFLSVLGLIVIFEHAPYLVLMFFLLVRDVYLPSKKTLFHLKSSLSLSLFQLKSSSRSSENQSLEL